MALSINAAFEALGRGAGNNVVHHLRLAQHLFGQVAFVTAIAFDIRTNRRNMNIKRDHFKATFIVLRFANHFTVLHEYKATHNCNCNQDNGYRNDDSQHAPSSLLVMSAYSLAPTTLPYRFCR